MESFSISTVHPGRVSAKRVGKELLELDLWNDDGTHVMTISLAGDLALATIAQLANSLAA